MLLGGTTDLHQVGLLQGRECFQLAAQRPDPAALPVVLVVRPVVDSLAALAAPLVAAAQQAPSTARYRPAVPTASQAPPAAPA